MSQAELSRVSDEEKSLRQRDIADPFAGGCQVTPISFVPNDSIHAESSAAARQRLNQKPAHRNVPPGDGGLYGVRVSDAGVYEERTRANLSVVP